MRVGSIAVVGGTGFIGTRLVRRLLESGHGVRIVDRARSRAYPALWVGCDVRDEAALTRACRGCEVIINLAAEHLDNVDPPRLYDEVNVGGARALCRSAAALGISKVIFTSSVAVYGFSEHEMDETAEPRPFNAYGRSKLKAEGVFQEWACTGPSRSLTIIRPTATFGEGNRANVYNLLRQISRKRFVMVGDGSNRKSIAYVENVAAFLEYALRFGPGEHLFNYVDKPDYDMNTLVRVARQRLGQPDRIRLRLSYPVGYALGLACDGVALVTRRKLPVSRVRVRKFCENSQFSARKALGTGFRPPVTLEEGLHRVIRADFGAVADGHPGLVALPGASEGQGAELCPSSMS